jgi:hypothetical protein
MEKSHVGMSLCYLCQEPKELLFHKQLAKTIPDKAVYNYEPCDECKGYIEQGVILISVRDGEYGNNPYRTGGWVVIKKDAFKKIFQCAEEALEKGVAFIEDTAWDKVGLPRKEELDA